PDRGVSRSLRRTLAVRFAATMGAGLVAVAVAAYCATRLVLRQQLDHGLAAAAYLAYEHFASAGEHAGLDPLLVSDAARYARPRPRCRSTRRRWRGPGTGRRRGRTACGAGRRSGASTPRSRRAG